MEERIIVNNSVSNNGCDVRNNEIGFKATIKTTSIEYFFRNLEEIEYIRYREIIDKIRLISSAEYNIALLSKKIKDPVPITRGYRGSLAYSSGSFRLNKSVACHLKAKKSLFGT